MTDASSASELRARDDYFREDFAYDGRPLVDGIEAFFLHPGFVEAAKQVHGRPVIEPASVVANVMIPGQEVALHTDVPEFRGVQRKRAGSYRQVLPMLAGCQRLSRG